MWKTVFLLIVSLVIIPIVTFKYDITPSKEQWGVIQNTYTLCLVIAGLCFFISTISKNYSQVDKLWSILPIIYGWITYFELPDKRILLMAILISVWGLRLTYNFYRRGGYQWKFWQGEEDYRWAILRSKPEFQASWKWILFNFFFISLYQMSLIWLMTTPIIKSTQGPAITWMDYLLFAFGLGFIILESIADQQQWTYQKEKHRLAKDGSIKDPYYQKGFTHTGLWGLMRHPNYFAEQSFWITIYIFSVISTGTLINWSIAGCLLLILLFKGSSDFSEEISGNKYPDYKLYQDTVPRFIPFTKSKQRSSKN